MGSWQVECPDNNISWWKRQIWWEEGCSSEFHFPESVEPASSGGSMYTSTRSTTMSMYTAGTNNITSFVTNWSGNKLKLKSWHEFFCFNNSHTPRVHFYAYGSKRLRWCNWDRCCILSWEWLLLLLLLTPRIMRSKSSLGVRHTWSLTIYIYIYKYTRNTGGIGTTSMSHPLRGPLVRLPSSLTYIGRPHSSLSQGTGQVPP